MLKHGVAHFEIHSSTWWLEVSIAGAGFAICGQFINRADNWENRALEHSIPEPVGPCPSDAPQCMIWESDSAQGWPTGL